jgi:hypothetical protein
MGESIEGRIAHLLAEVDGRAAAFNIIDMDEAILERGRAERGRQTGGRRGGLSHSECAR